MEHLFLVCFDNVKPEPSGQGLSIGKHICNKGRSLNITQLMWCVVMTSQSRIKPSDSRLPMSSFKLAVF